MIKQILNMIVIGILVGFVIFSFQANQVDPVVDDQITQIVEDWKEDVSTVGLDGNELIKRIDKIKIVERIPIGLFNSRSTDGVIGRFDYSTRSIYILARKYEEHQLKALVYHELGHYLFNLNHTDGEYIMSTHISEDKGYYKNNWDNLLPKYLEKCKESR